MQVVSRVLEVLPTRSGKEGLLAVLSTPARGMRGYREAERTYHLVAPTLLPSSSLCPRPTAEAGRSHVRVTANSYPADAKRSAIKGNGKHLHSSSTWHRYCPSKREKETV